ncbi:hypothetical protein NVP1261O_35 [Vibrio phage 1.261.O._10N.286.51.A7]|uniref:Uncharacterized protein n=1 Tax=Vibrio phage 1.261.O._10N.286.51.A7 TaxID=1881237 RepID=A0A2I7RZF4_9CAUD|nr:hypothetical protein HOU80_gp67 [Vibrio phage 1.261.O._10N.286.51.A7]AUR99039.1 hypothetical protein NVP1261O_35 [Vibrio phage 1.261.O._10N.286.51.A7]
MSDKYLSFHSNSEYIYWRDNPVITGGDEIIITLLWKQYSTYYPENVLLAFSDSAYNVHVTNIEGNSRLAWLECPKWNATLFGLDDKRRSVKFTLPFFDEVQLELLRFGANAQNLSNFQGALFELEIKAASGDRKYLLTVDHTGKPTIVDILGTGLDGFMFNPATPMRVDIPPVNLGVGDTIEMDVMCRHIGASNHFFDTVSGTRSYFLMDSSNRWYYSTANLSLEVDGVATGDRTTASLMDRVQHVKLTVTADCNLDRIGQNLNGDANSGALISNFVITAVDGSRKYAFDKTLGNEAIVPDSFDDTVDYGAIGSAVSDDGAFIWATDQWTKSGAEEDAILKLFPVLTGEAGVVYVDGLTTSLQLIHVAADATVTVLPDGNNAMLVAQYIAPADGHIAVQTVGAGTGSITKVSHYKGGTHGIITGDGISGYAKNWTITDALFSGSVTSFTEPQVNLMRASSYLVVEEGMNEKPSVNNFKAVALVKGYRPQINLHRASSYMVVEEGMTDKTSVNNFKAVAMVAPPAVDKLYGELDHNSHTPINDYETRLRGKQLLTNSDFASGDFTDWTTVAGTVQYIATVAAAQTASPKGKGRYFMVYSGENPTNPVISQTGQFDDELIEAGETNLIELEVGYQVSTHTDTATYTSSDYGYVVLRLLDSEGNELTRYQTAPTYHLYQNQSWIPSETKFAYIKGAVAWEYIYYSVRRNTWALLTSGDLELNAKIGEVGKNKGVFLIPNGNWADGLGTDFTTLSGSPAIKTTSGYNGSNHAFGGTSSASSGQVLHDISSIASDSLERLEFSWRQSSYDNDDAAGLDIELLDIEGNILAQGTSDVIAAPKLGTWTLREINLDKLEGTSWASATHIRIQFNWQRYAGTNSDGYVDDLRLNYVS